MLKKVVRQAKTPQGHVIELVQTIHRAPTDRRYTWPTFAYVVNGNALYVGDLQRAYKWYRWAEETFCR